MTSMPFDQHFLMSLVAPRSLLVYTGFTDDWTGFEAMAFGYYTTRETYKYLGIEDSIGIFAQDAGHEFNTKSANALADFANNVFNIPGDAYATKRTFTTYPYPTGVPSDIGTGLDTRRATDYARMNWSAEYRTVAAIIKFDNAKLTLDSGSSATLNTTVTPDNATGINNRHWSSSDETVATVDNEGTVKAVAPGTATITLRVGGVTADTTVTVLAPGSAMVSRFYASEQDRHLWTASDDESNVLSDMGWTREGDAFVMDEHNGNAVYRLYDGRGNQHLWTTSQTERDHLVGLGWNDEGIAFHESPTAAKDVYRLYNPWTGEHLWTTSAQERDSLSSLPGGSTWTYEGVAFKALN